MLHDKVTKKIVLSSTYTISCGTRRAATCKSIKFLPYFKVIHGFFFSFAAAASSHTIMAQGCDCNTLIVHKGSMLHSTA